MKPYTQAGSARAAVGEALVRRREHLLALVKRRAAGRVDAEEVLQVALGRALERSAQVRDPAKVEAWIGRLVRNVLVDELRKRRQRTLPIEALELATIQDGNGLDCWCALVQAEQLKPEHSRILRRVIVDGAPVTQVAAELGITPNNAMVRLHRARAALKARLKSHCGTTSPQSCADCGCDERGCCPQPIS